MASGIKDKVVILGAGCSKFGERWDCEPADLMAEAFEECIADAGIEKSQIEAAWQSTGVDAFSVGPGAMPKQEKSVNNKVNNVKKEKK